jgi:hypothetical protein
MSDQKKPLTTEHPLHSHIMTHINNIAYDMNCEMFDGWYKEHCRNILKEVRDHINKVLER